MDYVNLHIWIIFIVIFILISGVAYSFYRLGLNHSIKEKKFSGIIASSILGLVALILSFSFSMSISRYEDRRRLAVDEANAIGTSYLRVQLLRDVPGIDIQSLYKRYLNERIAYFEEELSHRRLQNAEELQAQIWNHFKQVVRVDKTAMESLYGFALNDMIDVSNKRNFALIKTLPVGIYIVIVSMAIIAFAILSYERGCEREKSRWEIIAFIIIFCVMFSLIYDIDHAHHGLIQVSQDALLKLRSGMNL